MGRLKTQNGVFSVTIYRDTIGFSGQRNINNNIFSLLKHLTNALRCTFTCYAIETILTTNRTDSLQYTALIAAYKAYPPYGARTQYLSLSTPDVIQCAIAAILEKISAILSIAILYRDINSPERY